VHDHGWWLFEGDVDGALALLRRLAAQVTRTSSFPPPAGYSSWSDAAVDELLVEMIDKKKGVAFLLEVLTTVDNQSSAERYLLVTIENFLKDQAKSTAHGKLRARLETVLGNDSRFHALTTPDRGWRLVGGPEGWWQGEITTLARAAFQVRGVSIPSWNRAGPTPRPAREALTTVAAAVLTVAAGVVRAEDLSRVLLERFRDAIAPETAEELVVDDVDEPTAGADSEPERALASISAEELWASFTPEQRAVVPYLIAPEDAPAALGIGSREAEARVAQVIELVRLATVDDSRAEAVVTSLLHLGCATIAPVPGLGRPSQCESPSTNRRMGA